MTGTLWTESVTPAELTGFARAAVEDLERRKGTLAPYLPNHSVPDVVVRTVVDSDGQGELAQYRSFDAETPIGSGGKGSRKTFELAPLGLKERVGEYDQLRRRNEVATLIRSGIDGATVRVSNAVVDRLEVARGQVLDTGKLSIDENGFVQEIDFGRPGSHSFDADSPWNDTAVSDPVEILVAWCNLYADVNDGAQPGVILTSRKVVAALQRSASIRAIVATLAGSPSIVSREALNAALASFDLPPLVIYDRKIRGQYVLNPDAIYLLPAGVSTAGVGPLGATFYGQTLEATEPEYGLAPEEQPGLVVGTWKTRDPIAVWVHSNAIAMPIMVNPRASMVIRVIQPIATYLVEVAGTAGTFTLTFRGNTTAPLAYNAAPSAVKSALVGLDDGFKAADWTVGGSAGALVITTPGGSLLSDGGTGGATVSVTRA